MRVGAEIMLEEINKHPTLLEAFNLNVLWQDGQCTEDVGAKPFLENLLHDRYTVFAPGVAVGDLERQSDTAPFNQTWGPAEVFPGVVGLVGSGCSASAKYIAPIAYQAYYPMVSNAATRPVLSNRELYPNFFRTVIPESLFCLPWLSLAKMLGQPIVAVVIADTATWLHMGKEMARRAKELDVSMLGEDLSLEIPGFVGTQVSTDSLASASEAAGVVLRLKPRVVPLLTHERRARLVMCEAHKASFLNAVFMSFGWFAFGWWASTGTDCLPAELTAIATGSILADIKFWREDGNALLSCSEAMTAEEFKVEWFKRQGKAVGDLSKIHDGHILTPFAASTADAVCMYAMMLQDVLVVRRIPLEILTQRTRSTYDAVQEAFAATNFEGPQGTVKYAPNSADPDGTVILQQLQAGDKIVDIADFKQGSFSFLGKGSLVFQFPGETFGAGPPGATSVSGALTLNSFTVCTGGLTLNMSSNLCQDSHCPTDEIYLDALASCACQAGTIRYATDKCSHCVAGSIAPHPGARKCLLCDPGKYAPGRGLTSCRPCKVGYYADRRGHDQCVPCPGNGRFPDFWTTLKQVEKSGSKQWVPTQGAINSSSCGCEEGTRQIGSRECEECGEGLRCLGMNEVRINPGYTSEAIISVYSCSGDVHRCVGGEPPTTCAHGFQGPACARCAPGRKQSGEECQLCGDTEARPGFVALVTFPSVVIGCGIFYHQNNMPVAPIGLAWISTLSYLQAMAVVCTFSITIPADLLSVFEFFNIFVLDLGYLGLDAGCAFGNASLARLLVRLLWPLLLLGGFLTVLVLSRFVKFLTEYKLGRAVATPLELLPARLVQMLERCELRRFSQNLARDTGRLPLRKSVLFWWPVTWVRIKSAIINCQSALFIVLTRCAVEVFALYEQPSGIRTVKRYPDVLAHSSKWWTLLPLALASLAVYSVGFFAFVAYVVIVAPRHFGDSLHFRLSYKNLWDCFDADSWWFCLVLLLYGLVVNFIPIVTTNGGWQLIFCVVLITLYIVILTEHRPWKFHVNHSCDFWGRLGSLACVLVLFFEEDSPSNLVKVILAMPIAFAVCRLVLYVWSRTAAAVKTVRQRVAFAQRLDDITRIVGNMEMLELRMYALQLLDNDMLAVDRALDVMQITLLGLQHKSRWQWRCQNIPFEVAVDGRLEGEVQARNARKDHDCRSLVRALLASLTQADPRRNNSTSSSNLRTSVVVRKIQGMMPEVHHFIKWLDAQNDSGQNLTKDTFVSSTLQYTSGHTGVSSFPVTPSLTEEELSMVFEYLDLDMSGNLSSQELAVQLTALSEVQFSAAHKLVQSSQELVFSQELAVGTEPYGGRTRSGADTWLDKSDSI